MSDSGPDPAAPPSTAPPADEVNAQLERLVSSPDFAQSSRLQRFLRYIVSERLAGRAAALKEYAIALEVFDRDEAFDPQTSSIVRVEASRLRARLEKYNATEGRNDPLHISLPPGGYTPTFRRIAHPVETEALDQTAASMPDGRSAVSPRRAIAPAAVFVIIVAVGSFLFDRLYVEPAGDGAPETSSGAPAYAVAVLPLRNLSGDPKQDYFSDGITDALIASLAKTKSVRVISMTSIMAYKNVSRPVADIARELGVTHVIEGSVLRIGDRIRISAQLIEAASDDHLWAESYERDAADTLAIQNEVVGAIVAALPELAATTAGVETASAIDPAAYEAQLKGRFFLRKMTAEGFRKGITYFKQAIEREPGYAAAYSGMASCYCLLGGHGFELVERAKGMRAAREAVMEALRLQDSQAEPHAFLGVIRLKYEWDWPGAEEAFQRSIELNPSLAQARLFYSFYLEAMGRQDEAIREAEEARAIDPLSPAINMNLGWQYLRAGRLEDAKKQFESTGELNSHLWGAHWGMGDYHRRKGAYDAAIAAFQRALEVRGGHVLPLSDLGYTYAVAGMPGEARAALERLQALAEKSYVSPYNMATIHVGLGEHDEAFVWLDKAYEQRSRSLAWLNVADEYDGLRAEPRFQALAQRIGLP